MAAVDPRLAPAAARARAAVSRAEAWLAEAGRLGTGAAEAGARRLALTLGLALETALLAEHAAWALGRGDPLPARAAERLSRRGLDLLDDAADPCEAASLARDDGETRNELR